MPLHLVKLCVGVDDVDDLANWQKRRRAQLRAAGKKPVTRHLTRNAPRRADEVLDGGSLYWVIKGVIRVRQRIIGIDPDCVEGGEPKCALRLDTRLVRVAAKPMRPFQGWRYLEAQDAPPDLASLGSGAAEMPEQMAEDLRALGLL